MSRTSSGYELLSTTEADGLLHKTASENSSEKDPSNTRTTVLLIVSSLVCLLSTLVNAYLIGSIHFKSARQSYTPLEHISSYHGLDKAVHSPSYTPPKPIDTFPSLLVQVNASEPHRSLYAPKGHESFIGTFYPNEYPFIVDNGVSTFAQMRVADFAMEKCRLRMTLPSADALMNSTPRKGLAIPDEGVFISVWRIASTNSLDLRTLTWKTRPQRQALAASWRVIAGGSYESDEFNCPGMSLQVFELACSAGSSCGRLEFMQDAKSPRLAFYITQRSSALE